MEDFISEDDMDFLRTSEGKCELLSAIKDCHVLLKDIPRSKDNAEIDEVLMALRDYESHAELYEWLYNCSPIKGIDPRSKGLDPVGVFYSYCVYTGRGKNRILGK